MSRPGLDGALDTPRTNLGDATFLQQPPELDFSQELSFQSPEKGSNNLVTRMRNTGRGRGLNPLTPRGRRSTLANRHNPPFAAVGGNEFTPLLKSAARNSVRRLDKEIRRSAAVPPTPLGLDRIEEDLTALPAMDTSVYAQSRHDSYVDHTLPQVDTSSAMSTPVAAPARRNAGAPLQDGNKLSLREQEKFVDRVEKENFGLKLKIHFLDQSMRKLGPGYSEAALKENAELKVDKHKMQHELGKYKKNLKAVEKELEGYRQQLIQFQEHAKRKYVDEQARAELDRLRQTLEVKDADIEDLRRQLDQGQADQDQIDKLRDEVADLEADIREKDLVIGEREDEAEDLRDKLAEVEGEARDSKNRVTQLEQELGANDQLEEANGAIEELGHQNRLLESQLRDAQAKLEKAAADKDRAEHDLEELREEIANKSVAPRGLARQTDEKVTRLQNELDTAGRDFVVLETEHAKILQGNGELRSQLREANRQREAAVRHHQAVRSELEELRADRAADLARSADEKRSLKLEKDSLASQYRTQQQLVAELEQRVQQLEDELDQERNHGLEMEKHVSDQARNDVDRLNAEISDLQAEIREKDNLYDNDSEKWEMDRQELESARAMAEGRAADLQRTIDTFREFEGSLSDKEARLQEAMESEARRHEREAARWSQRIEELQKVVEARQASVMELRSEVSAAHDELRQKELECQAQADKAEALEDEVEVLQNALDEEAEQFRRDLEAAQKESEELQAQLGVLRHTAAASSSQQSTRSAEAISNLEKQLSGLRGDLVSANREKQGLRDKLADADLQLQTLEAARGELEAQIQRSRHQDEHTSRLDQERIDLRTSKLKLDNEVRRLREENRTLMDRKSVLEKSLEDEISRAAGEEEELRREISQIQSQQRQTSSSESQELATARRAIRDLERRIVEYETRLAASSITQPGGGGGGEGNSELSIIRRDLTCARQRELEYLQRESSHKEAIRGLRRQVTGLERQAHEAEISRLLSTPKSSVSGDSGRKTELSELRHQLLAAQQSISELKSRLRDGERKSSQATRDLQRRIDDLGDQKRELETCLEDVRRDAEDAAALHETSLHKLNQRLEKAERERRSAQSASSSKMGDPRDLAELLRQTQDEADALEHDLCEQQAIIDALTASELSTRRKLERTRSERAAYRLAAEKLQRDVKILKASAEAVVGPGTAVAGRIDGGNFPAVSRSAVPASSGSGTPKQEERHVKELRGMMMQMEWMQARWERETILRADAAYAKKFLQLQLEVATACNNAQLRELEHIRRDVLGNRNPLPPSVTTLQKKQQQGPGRPQGAAKLRAVFVAVRFVVRAHKAAKRWAGHEKTRKRIVKCVEHMKKQRKSSIPYQLQK